MANLKNGAIGIVATAPSPANSGTSLAYQSGHGSRQPATPYFATAYPPGVLPNPSNWEIVQVTARSTDTITIVRAQKGSTAQNIAVGWIIANGIYDDDIYNAGISAPELLSGTPNGVLTTFGLSQSYSSLIALFKNGVYMRPGSGNDYVLNAAGNQVTFSTAPATSSVLMAIGIVGSQSMIIGGNSMMPPEIPTGLVNGTNKAFTLSRAYVAGSTFVYINGLLQQPKVHYVETSPTTGIITLDDAPLTGDNVLIAYQWSMGVTGNADTVDGFNASATPTANQLVPLDSNAKAPLIVLPTVIIGSAKTNTQVTGITTGETAVISTVVTITPEMVASGRKLKIKGAGSQLFSTVSSDRVHVGIFDGTTTLNQIYQGAGASANGWSPSIETPQMAMPAAGTYTFSIRLARDIGSGSITFYADATSPIWMEVRLE